MCLRPDLLTPINPGEPAMPMNRIQFQPSVSLPEFFEHYGTEEQSAAALSALR